MKQKLQQLTWTIKETGETQSHIAEEDHIDILLGRLMDTYWDPEGGWAIKYKIKNVRVDSPKKQKPHIHDPIQTALDLAYFNKLKNET
jgi:hypothetical protein